MTPGDNIFLGLVEPPAHFTGGGPVTPHGPNREQSGTLTLGALCRPRHLPRLRLGDDYQQPPTAISLSFDYEGFLNAETGEGTGTFIFTGGTGRFARATGGGTFDALIDLLPTASTDERHS